MKKKGLILFVGLLLIATVYAATTHTPVRMAGTNVDNPNGFYVVMDSTDSLHEETIWSDTVSVTEGSDVNLSYYYIDYTENDSANDSIVIIVHAFGTYSVGGGITAGERLLFTDTIHDTNAITTLAGTVTDYHYFDLDTLLLENIYFRTIVKDSVILDADGTQGKDSCFLQLRFDVAQRICE